MLLRLRLLAKLRKNTVINRFRQEFKIRFSDLDQMRSEVLFISNLFMNMEKTCIAKQLSATFWCLADTEMNSGACTAAMKVGSLFGLT